MMMCRINGHRPRLKSLNSTSSPANRNSEAMPSVDSKAKVGSWAWLPTKMVAAMPRPKLVSGAGMRNRCTMRGKTTSAKISISRATSCGTTATMGMSLLLCNGVLMGRRPFGCAEGAGTSLMAGGGNCDAEAPQYPLCGRPACRA